MHFLGLNGMPRRIPDYPDAFSHFNDLATQGSTLSFLSTLFFFYMISEHALFNYEKNYQSAVNDKSTPPIPFVQKYFIRRRIKTMWSRNKKKAAYDRIRLHSKYYRKVFTGWVTLKFKDRKKLNRRHVQFELNMEEKMLRYRFDRKVLSLLGEGATAIPENKLSVLRKKINQKENEFHFYWSNAYRDNGVNIRHHYFFAPFWFKRKQNTKPFFYTRFSTLKGVRKNATSL